MKYRAKSMLRGPIRPALLAGAGAAALSLFSSDALADARTGGADETVVIDINCSGNGNCDGNNNIGSNNGSQNGNGNVSVSGATAAQSSNGPVTNGFATFTVDCSGGGNCNGNNNTGSGNGSQNGNGNVTVSGAAVSPFNIGTAPNGFATLTITGNQNQGNSAIGGGAVTLTGKPGETITLDATKDPVITVTNGTAAGTASISNGNVAAGNSLQVGTGANTVNVINGTVTAPGTITGGNLVSNGNLNVGGSTAVNNFAVNPGSAVNMGGNAVHDVGTPVFGTDAANKAYVDRASAVLGNRIGKADEGVAIAMSLATPVFQPGQTFVIQGGWGAFQNTDAFGFTAAGLLARDTFGLGSTVTLSGGIGTGTDNGTVAGRAAVAIGW